MNLFSKIIQHIAGTYSSDAVSTTVILSVLLMVLVLSASFWPVEFSWPLFTA